MGAAFCSQCGARLMEAAAFCSLCGSPVIAAGPPANVTAAGPVDPSAPDATEPTVAYCPRCNTPVSSDAAGCDVCGYPGPPMSSSSQEPAKASARSQVQPFLEGKGPLNNTRWVVEHSLDLIENTLDPGEVIHALAVCRKPATLVLLATNERILGLIKGGVLTGITQMNRHQLFVNRGNMDIPYASLDAVAVRRGFGANGSVGLLGPSLDVTFELIENDLAERFGKYVSARIRERQAMMVPPR